MKKIILFTLLVFITNTTIKAQAPSFGFESWAFVPNSTTVKDPIGWASFNLLTSAFMAKTVDTTSASFSGTYAAKITTQDVPSFLQSSVGYNKLGLLVLGTISLSGTTPKILYGTTYTGRPATITFATKYTPVGIDTGWVLVQLTKWNVANNRADTMATGKFQTLTNSTTWTLQTIDLSNSYTTQTALPDTMKIYCSSSSLYNPKVGSSLWVDDFSFNGWVSTNDIDAIKNSVSIFPNPATNSINLKCTAKASFVEFSDVTGRKMGLYNMIDNTTNIQTTGFAPGIYLYAVLNEKKEVINRGKFEIAK